MTSPHHLHAIRTAWALHTALGRLAELTAIAARQRVDGALAAATALRAPIYGVRHATGGHADPVSARVSAPDSTGDAAGWADLTRRATGRLEWIADMISAPGSVAQLMAANNGYDPLFRIQLALPRLQSGTAADLTRHLADEDRWIRAAVRLAPAGAPLVGVPCPRCDQRTLTVHTDGPEHAWTITCACVCVGQGCTCQMPGAVEGVAHIWPRSVVLTPATTSQEN